MKTWLLSGGTGLIGSALATSLVEDGHRVTVLSRTKAAERDGLTFVEWTPTQAGPWQDHVSEADVVVHLAGAGIAEKRWTDERMRELRSSRIDSGKLISQALARKAKAGAVYISGSAVGYYGMRSDDLVCDESTPASPDTLGALCKDWEDSADAARSAGIRVVHPRVGVVLARGGGMLKEVVPPFRAFVGGPMGSGTQWLPWIHIADVVDALRFSASSTFSGPFNLSGPTPVTMNEFAKTMGEVLHRPSLLRVPELGLRIALGEMANVILRGQRAIPKKLTDEGFKFKFPTLRDALKNVLG
ncbi:MAG: TIGR01777 family oxidoreductase [Polyangiaceae bacterium]|nr:TIGR01777 family oxidoreductase [Polyangiaceae bacterium]